MGWRRTRARWSNQQFRQRRGRGGSANSWTERPAATAAILSKASLFEAKTVSLSEGRDEVGLCGHLWAGLSLQQRPSRRWTLGWSRQCSGQAKEVCGAEALVLGLINVNQSTTGAGIVHDWAAKSGQQNGAVLVMSASEAPAFSDFLPVQERQSGQTHRKVCSIWTRQRHRRDSKRNSVL